MTYDEPDPNPLEAKRLIDELCKQLRAVEKDVPEDMRAELQGYLSTLEQSSQGIVDEFNQVQTEYDAAMAQAKARAENPPPAPAAPTEEDVLPLGLALRDQLLGRYRVVRAAAPSHDLADVAGMDTDEFKSSEHKPGTGIRRPAPDPKPQPKPKGDDAWDISSGEWNKD